MAALSLSLLILASLAVINAQNCNKLDSNSRLYRFLDIENKLRSLPEENEIQTAIELTRDFFKTSPFPIIGHLDPLYIETHELRLQDDDDDMDADCEITATTIKGLLGFEVNDIKASLNLEKLQMDFLFPEISVSGNYNLRPTEVLQELEVFGDGEFDITVRNVLVRINVDIGKTSDTEMFVEKLESELNLETVDAKVTGLFDDELESEAASLRISEFLPEYVPYIKDAIDEFLMTYTEYVNTKLKFAQFLKRQH
ncbi:hypothetical protein CBL_06789 [Carabus blaptoides fortunei]